MRPKASPPLQLKIDPPSLNFGSCYYPGQHPPTLTSAQWQAAHDVLAEPIEALVVEQICQVLRAPESLQAVWDRVPASTINLDEARVVVPMRQLAAVWPSLFPAEQRRLAQLLIERVLIGDDGLEILWRDAGWVELIDELPPGSIGAELAEVEMTV